MSVIVRNIRIDAKKTDSDAIFMAKKIIGIKDIKGEIAKKGIDLRKGKVTFVYSVVFDEIENEDTFVEKLSNRDVSIINKEKIEFVIGSNPLTTPPVICGFGPAGIFAGLILAQNGYNPIIFEGGSDVDSRTEKVTNYWTNNSLDTRCNVQFGEGGAGTFSDGKLTTRISDKRCSLVLDQLVRFGAPKEILYLSKPHLGTDNLREIVKNIRNEIISLGGKIYFDDKIIDLTIKNDRIIEVKSEKQGVIPCSHLILAIGHSARDTYEMLYEKGISMDLKAFSVGIRAEHLQENLNKSLYKSYYPSPNLPQGEYQLSHREGERCCYSFCMCPGGTVVASASEENTIVTNGMSNFMRDEKNGNSAICVNVTPQDFGSNHPLSGVNFQRQLEKKAYELGGKNGNAPISTLKAFLNNEKSSKLGCISPSYTGGTTFANLNDLFPTFVNCMLKKGFAAFERNIRGFSDGDTILTGVESRTSAPLRITRNEGFESINVRGLYPCGEGSGYAGGIVSAAVDGIKVASAIMERYAP